jgi:hypothetical protein
LTSNYSSFPPFETQKNRKFFIIIKTFLYADIKSGCILKVILILMEEFYEEITRSAFGAPDDRFPFCERRITEQFTKQQRQQQRIRRRCGSYRYCNARNHRSALGKRRQQP